MSSTLTENVVLVRTRSHDLNSVKKLNCWGCTLKDVSIVNRMPNVEVISLSINSIDTLQYFSSCTMLQELYLRKNEIKDINEILHLSQLQFLKKLSLEDNPCANVDNYRLTVLKALPNLEFLDNIKVTAEELYQAEKLGRELVWPGTETDDTEDETNDTNNSIGDFNPNCYKNETSPVHESSNQVSNNTVTVSNGLLLAQEYQPIYNGLNSSDHIGTTCTNYVSNRNQGNNPVHNKECNSNSSKKTNMAKANSLSDYNIYSANGNFRCSSPALSGNTYETMNEYYENGQPTNNTGQTYYMPNNNSFRSSSSSRTNAQSASSTQQRILPKGGKNRNANILSAVLCLIKELDYGSLEVVDTTIHCRMEEMED